MGFCEGGWRSKPSLCTSRYMGRCEGVFMVFGHMKCPAEVADVTAFIEVQSQTCPSGYETITDAEDCEQASKVLGKEAYGGSPSWVQDACYFTGCMNPSSSMVYLRTSDDNPSAPCNRTFYRSYCRQVATNFAFISNTKGVVNVSI